MGKQRRPRGPRSTWEPKPVPVDDPATTPESPPIEASPAAARPVPEPSAVEPSERPTDGSAREIALEADLPTVSPVHPVATASALSSVVGDDSAVESALPDESEPDAAPVRRAAGLRMAFAPERVDLAGIGATITGYVRGEGEAAAAHIRALGSARSPAELIRLQVGEIQRAADASLTCWSRVARGASRAFASR